MPCQEAIKHQCLCQGCIHDFNTTINDLKNRLLSLETKLLHESQKQKEQKNAN